LVLNVIGPKRALEGRDFWDGLYVTCDPEVTPVVCQ